jgi:type IV pilus assembly protein PilM
LRDEFETENQIKMNKIHKSPARPRLACEVGADRVIAARADDRGTMVSLCTTHSLPEGAVVPGFSGNNVLNGSALRLAISEALAMVRARSREVIAVLPDASVRVTLLDFDTLPEKEQDAAAIIRFRLKKALPFNVDSAALSYHVTRNGADVKVVAAVAPQSVIEEYEIAFRDSGYNPGVVVPSTLAALGVVDAERPTLIVKVDANTTSVAIVDQGQLRLLRTLENPNGAAVTGAQIAADVYPSVVFFEDSFGAKIEHVLLGGLPAMSDIAAGLESQTGVRVQNLVSGRHLATSPAEESVPASLLAPVVGALVA